MSLKLRGDKSAYFRRTLLFAVTGLLLITVLVAKRFESAVPTAEAASSGIVISQIYGGGGNSGATYTNDFIELFNRGASPVTVTGWTVQYASATGATWQTTALTGTIQPGQYYLVQEGVGAGGTTPLPTPDATGTIAMSATAGKVALVNNATALSGACPTGATIIDFVGFGTTANCFEGTGPAPAPSNTNGIARNTSGCTETDQNATDFTAGAPAPRNTSSTISTCSGVPTPTPGGTPALSINDVTLAEGNTGTTTFNFTVSLNSPAGTGGVTFDITTQDGTATVANNDYVAKTLTGQTIAAGNQTYTFAVLVNGDTAAELTETFSVVVSNVSAGATVSDAQGTGTINNDDASPSTAIYTIQGSGTASPFNAQSVTTTGIVTGVKSNGYFLQDPTGDGNPNTSDGVFVFTSSAPPAASIVIGNSVQVTATVQEFRPLGATGDPNSPPTTELVGPFTVSVLSTGNALPAPILLTAAATTAPSGTTNPLDTLEEFEGMRVSVSSMTVVAPSQGSITEPSATVSSNGVFYGVVTGVARPFREPGVAISDPLPAGAPANVPRFDENPERIRVDSDALGAPLLDLPAGTTLTNVTGPLDYGFRTYTIDPDAATPPTVSSPLPVFTPPPVPTSTEFTIASFNMERFFDTVDDAGTSDPILTATAYQKRLGKASLVIRNAQRSPDVIGVEEVEKLSVLQDVAARINTDTVNAGGANPNYQAYLVEGNDVGGIDVGFLVKASRVNVVDVTQVGKDATYLPPGSTTPALLNDRPSLVLRATIQRPGTLGLMSFTVIVNHLRSLNGVDDPVDGGRVREKRKQQAEFLANYIQSRQTADPTEKIISVGDYNAFSVNDGYVDLIGTIKGQPAPSDQVVLASPDLVNPDLTNLVDTLTTEQRYSYSFDGNAQVLDHELANPNMLSILTRFAYARDDADFPVKYYEDGTRPERISDHDQPIAYFSLAATAQPGRVLISEFRFNGPGGSSDEFVELYNNTESAINLAGWRLNAPSPTPTGFPGNIVFIGSGTIAPRGHFLIAQNAYSASAYPAGTASVATPDLSYADAAFIDTGGVNLVDQNGTVVDAVGFNSTSGTGFREGNGLSTTGITTVGGNEQYSFVRRMTTGLPQDTNDNAADFVLVSTTGTLGFVPSVVSPSAPVMLGAPGPENTVSPIQRNALLKVSLLDNCSGMGQPNSGCQNLVRDSTATNPTTAQRGTLTFRRRFTNTTGQPVDRLRFRVVDITTLNSPGYALNNGQADLRVITSLDTNIVPSNPFLSGVSGVPVRGTTLETPPTQNIGGGLNSTLTVNLAQPLASGSTITVQFVVGVQQNGNFRFFVNTEADSSPVLTGADAVHKSLPGRNRK